MARRANILRQTYSDLSPLSLFDKADDFTSDSAASPLSPVSPALSASSFGFPATDSWSAWGVTELSPGPEDLFACPPFNGPTLASCPHRTPPMSPAINPMDLAMPSTNGQPSIFQSPQVMVATVSSQQQKPAPLPIPSTSSTVAAAKRYPSRALKRKSSSASHDGEPAPKMATSPQSATSPKATTTRRSSNSTAAGASSKLKDTLAPKKTAHNMIEKRYRTNLNDKITQLRDAVPSLRIMARRADGSSPPDFGDAAADDEYLLELGGLAPQSSAAHQATKLNKATILSKATEYILQLERRNRGLETEISALRGRMEGLEMMLMNRSGAVAGVWN